MTSIIGWLAVDHRKASSLYFASDSRITWGSASANWDSGRKLFASRTSPDIFGFCGDVLFPTQALSSFIDLLDSGALGASEAAASDRHEIFCEVIRTAYQRRQNTPEEDFTIFHGARSGQKMDAEFSLWSLSFRKNGRKWLHKSYDLTHGHSRLVFAEGTGAVAVKGHYATWQASRAAGTSRAVFSAFCDALAAGQDARSGGAPQLVGLYRIWPGQTFGIYARGKAYVHGLMVTSHYQRSVFRWHNEQMEIVDPESGSLAEGAQAQPRAVARGNEP